MARFGWWCPGFAAGKRPLFLALARHERRGEGGKPSRWPPQGKLEKTLSAAYDVAGLGDITSVRRVLEIAVLDALGLDDSLARSKVLIGAAGTAVKLLEAEREESWGWDGDKLGEGTIVGSAIVSAGRQA